MSFSRDNNVVTTFSSHHCCNNLLTCQQQRTWLFYQYKLSMNNLVASSLLNNVVDTMLNNIVGPSMITFRSRASLFTGQGNQVQMADIIQNQSQATTMQQNTQPAAMIGSHLPASSALQNLINQNFPGQSLRTRLVSIRGHSL